MKKVFLIIHIFLLNLSFLFPQIQTWPPDGIQPSPYQLMLPGNRFIPSSSRYNLIWADQIIPYQVTDKQIEFAAKNYIGTQKIWTDQINLFRNYNSNFLGLIYHLAAGLNPEHNDDCPNPKNNTGSGFIGVVSPAGYVSEWTEHFLPWLNDKSITVGSNRFEEMFQHYDDFDSIHRVWHKDPYWLMNLENDDWQNYINDQCIAWMQGNSDEGCFFDVSVETYVTLYCPNLYATAPNNFDWWKTPHKPFNSPNSYDSPGDYAVWMNELYLKYYQKIYNNFHRAVADYLVIPNVDQMITTVYDPVWMDGDNNGETIDGAMIESFGNSLGEDMYLSLERAVRHITGRGKILIAQFDAQSPKERLRRTAMYMLIKNENSFININPQEVGWYPEYEIDLGEQSPCPNNIQDILYQENNPNNKIFERRYERGRVICNLSNQPVTIQPFGWIPEAVGKEYIISTFGGGTVSSEGKTEKDSIIFTEFLSNVILLPNECLITLMEAGTGIRNNEKSFYIDVFPNPAIDIINIETNLLKSVVHTIKIYDMLGNSIKSIENKILNSRQRIDISDLNPGVYFLQMNLGQEVLNKKFTIVE